jgi:hypothetical protein
MAARYGIGKERWPGYGRHGGSGRDVLAFFRWIDMHFTP